MRPGWRIGFYIFIVVAVVILTGLGSWQLDRLHWKESLIAKRQQAISAGPVAFDVAMEELERGSDVDWLKVLVRGRYNSARELHLFAVSDGQPGWKIVSPFIVRCRFIVLVDRGFVPDGRENDANHAAPVAETQLTAFLRKGSDPAGFFQPANQPERNQWYSWDLPEMLQSLALDVAREPIDCKPVPLNYYLQLAPATESADPNQPKPDAVNAQLRNNHLQYAITWYALALVIGVAGLFSIRRISSVGHNTGE